MVLILGVCILLRLSDQGEGFPSTQRYYSSFLIFIYSLICKCFLLHDHCETIMFDKATYDAVVLIIR
jgi:hypothetical protein